MKTNPVPTTPLPAHDADTVHSRNSRRAPRFHAGGLLLASALLTAGLCANAQDNTQPAVTNTGGMERADATNAPASSATASPTGLDLNFRNAPIDLVLEKLSDAAGFVIVQEVPVRGSITVTGHNLTKDEAVDLLNRELNKNDYAAIQTGRTLVIMRKPDAMVADNPVRQSNNPDDIPKNDVMATWIIPIRFVEAGQLVTDLSPFVSSSARIIANQAGNSIVITDTQANIHHLVEIIKAIDSSAEDVTVVRVIHLEHADPTEMANLITSLFQDQNNAAQAPFRFGRGGGGRGGGGFGGGGFGGGGPGALFAAMAGGGRGNTTPQQDRIKRRNQVSAVADPRTSSVVLTASRDLVDEIENMVKGLDYQSDKEMTVKVFHMDNADLQEIYPTLQSMFQTTTTGNRFGGNNQNSPLMQRLQQYQQNGTFGSGIGSMGSGFGGGGGRGGLGGGGGFTGF